MSWGPVTSKSEFYIFRDSRRSVSATELAAALRAELRGLVSSAQADQVNRLLLRAGELECGLRDESALPLVCQQAARLTDLFAEAAISLDGAGDCNAGDLVATASPLLDRISHSQFLEISVPEGFAYYALHPLDYADLVTRLALPASSAMVVGIRSIGTTLSAVVAAGLRQSGLAATRITARPTGHPYDRVCELDSSERQKIAAAVASQSEFLICDEGPGRSGSSLLSVAEALEREGVTRSQIHILCSHQPDISALCARDAAQRWSRYRVAYSGMTRRLPLDAAEYLSGGEWRRTLPVERAEWPATWPQLERLRYRFADATTVLTFEGHGHYGEAVRARSQALSDAGFTPPYLGQEQGFGRHAVLKGRVTGRDGLTPQLLARMAEYCGWRAREFRVPDVDLADLETMTRVNLEREFGAAPERFRLPVERPVICDAQMMPHAWLHTPSGWLKLDASTHGDGHFFPGSCDIAWDLAGIVVEWELSESLRDLLLSKYEHSSGDSASRRINSYVLAYATFRMAWSKMAAASVGDAEEEGRLLRDYRRYRQFVQKFGSGVTGQSRVLQPSQIQAQPA